MNDTILKVYEDLTNENVEYFTRKSDRFDDGLMFGNRNSRLIIRKHFPQFEDEFDALEKSMMDSIYGIQAVGSYTRYLNVIFAKETPK